MVFVTLVCSRRVSGPSPLHGTIVNNVDVDKNKQAFNTRVSTIPCKRNKLTLFGEGDSIVPLLFLMTISP